jgi:hypothetical protein
LTLFGSSVFAELIRSLEPYLDEIVFLGGWAQALYVLEAEGRGERVLRTTDIDLTLAPNLDRGERQPFLDLLRNAGFRVEAFDDQNPSGRLATQNPHPTLPSPLRKPLNCLSLPRSRIGDTR